MTLFQNEDGSIRRIRVFSLIGLFVVAIIGAGLVSAHGNGYRETGTMHDEMEEVLEEGTYEDFEALRDEYQMPIMPWIQSSEDFLFLQQLHERYEGNDDDRYGSMPCHR